jgi:phage/plasmid-like protein (TIGR03299 family)
MAHNIYNRKFISLRQPAWHGLGLVIQDEIDAVTAGEKLGLPIVYTEPVRTASGLEIPDFKCIVGKEKDKAPVPFSVVSKDYTEITHADFLIAWDKATGKAPIETIGLLGKGENLFVTTKMPKFDIKGDEMDSYLLAANILSGKEANFGRVTPVRVVCQNTLNLSASQFSDQYRLLHVGDAIKQIETWLRRVYQTAIEKQNALREAYAILADFTPSVNQVVDTLEATYPTSEKPNVDERTDEGLNILAAWQKSNVRQIEHQQAVNELFEGKAVGSDLRSARGTGWGLWNAVVEYEDYGKSRRQASSALFGAGADRKTTAFTQLLEFAKA